MNNLGIDKRKVKRKSWDMQKGGNHLLELLEKEFSLEYIEKNKWGLGINKDELTVLKEWVKNSTDLVETAKCLQEQQSIKKPISPSFIKSMLYFGGNGVLGKLYKNLDVLPKFDDKDNLIKRFSFLDYTDIKITDKDYRFVKIEINQSKFSSDQSSKIERDIFNKKIMLKKIDNVWKEVNDDFSKEYLESHKVLEKLDCF